MSQREVDHLRRLEAFCKANGGCPKAEIVRLAVKEFIDRRLAAEPEARRRYIEAYAPIKRLRVVR